MDGYGDGYGLAKKMDDGYGIRTRLRTPGYGRHHNPERGCRCIAVFPAVAVAVVVTIFVAVRGRVHDQIPLKNRGFLLIFIAVVAAVALSRGGPLVTVAVEAAVI